MFERIVFNINWGLLGVMSSIIIACIPLFLKLSRRKEKDIDFLEVDMNYIFKKPSGFEKDVKISFNGKDIESLECLSIYIKNLGSKIINYNDFNEQPNIEISGFNNIFKYEVYKSCLHTICSIEKISDDKIVINTDNFESDCYINVLLYFESIEENQSIKASLSLKNMPRKQIVLKDVQIERQLGLSQSYSSMLPIIFLPFFILLGVTALIARYGLGVNLSIGETYSWGWKLLFFLPSIIISLITSWHYYRRINRYNFGSLKIKQWHKVA